MTPAELKAAGWHATVFPEARPNCTMTRGNYLLMVAGCNEDDVYAYIVMVRPHARHRNMDRTDRIVRGDAQPFQRGCRDAAIAALGSAIMPDGRTVREWALAPPQEAP